MKNNVNIKKSVTVMMVINVLQILIIGGIALVDNTKIKAGMSSGFTRSSLTVFILVFFVAINSYIIIKRLVFNNLESYDNTHLKETIEQMESLNTVLRGQRHDFMNHLQVVYSLIEMKEFDEASNYIETVYKDIQKVNKILKTANPAVNALIQAKSIYCEEKGIDMFIDISTKLDNLKIPSWELCRVIGNIIDNAVQALEERGNNKKIQIEIFEAIKSYNIKIRNNGPKIPKEYLKKVFEVGFTTKKDRGDGMGLAIAKDTVNKHEGSITISSENNWTEFTLVLPMKIEVLDTKYDTVKQ